MEELDLYSKMNAIYDAPLLSSTLDMDADYAELISEHKTWLRSTTPALNSLIPESIDKLSPWKTKNYYFYEITNYKGELFIQLYFYCNAITPEMKKAFLRLANILNLGSLTKGYKLFFLSSSFQNEDDDTEDVIISQLNTLFDQVHAIEREVLDKWIKE